MERTIKYTLQGAAQNGYQGRKGEAVGRSLPSLVKKYLETSKKDVILHQLAVHFSTGTAVQFSPGIYNVYHSDKFYDQILVRTENLPSGYYLCELWVGKYRKTASSVILSK